MAETIYKVLLERRAERDLNNLETALRKRAVEKLLSLKNNPRPPIAKKLEGSKSAWRIRIGDWRIIYEINDSLKEVSVFRIKHRSKGYP